MKVFWKSRMSETHMQVDARKVKRANDNVAFAHLQFKELVKKNLNIPMKLYHL